MGCWKQPHAGNVAELETRMYAQLDKLQKQTKVVRRWNLWYLSLPMNASRPSVLLHLGVCIVATGDQRQHDQDSSLIQSYRIHPVPLAHVSPAAVPIRRTMPIIPYFPPLWPMILAMFSAALARWRASLAATSSLRNAAPYALGSSEAGWSWYTEARRWASSFLDSLDEYLCDPFEEEWLEPVGLVYRPDALLFPSHPSSGARSCTRY